LYVNYNPKIKNQITEQVEPMYQFITKAFKLGEDIYNVTIAPVFQSENGCLEFTGKYGGILIDPNYGTLPFEISMDDNAEWVPVQKGRIPQHVAYKIGKIIVAKSK